LPVRSIILGSSGAGKTGALLSLAAAGYRLWVYDFENGYPILKNGVRDKYPKLTISGPDDTFVGDINVMQISNGFRAFAGKLVPESDGYSRFNDALASWKAPASNAPFWLYTLTSRDIVIPDSLTSLGSMIQLHVMSQGGQISATDPTPKWQQYRPMKDYMYYTMGCLTNERMKAHLVVPAHIKEVTEGGEKHPDPKRPGEKMTVGGHEVGYPNCTGTEDSRLIGRFFNEMLFLTKEKDLRGTKRKFLTEAKDFMPLKSSAPFSIKPSYDIENGLAEFFFDILGEKPNG
jgi:hypothetical protein